MAEVLKCPRHPDAQAVPTHTPDLTWHCMVCFDELPLKSDPLIEEVIGEEETDPSLDFWSAVKR